LKSNHQHFHLETKNQLNLNLRFQFCQSQLITQGVSKLQVVNTILMNYKILSQKCKIYLQAIYEISVDHPSRKQFTVRSNTTILFFKW